MPDIDILDVVDTGFGFTKDSDFTGTKWVIKWGGMVYGAAKNSPVGVWQDTILSAGNSKTNPNYGELGDADGNFPTRVDPVGDTISNAIGNALRSSFEPNPWDQPDVSQSDDNSIVAVMQPMWYRDP